MERKLVSICIPTYNSATFIRKTLESVINQTYKNIEIIVGDNSSTDNTEEIVKEYMQLDNRIQYYRNEINLGYSGNCNKLIELAKGEYISIYHSDDIYNVNIVAKEVEVLDENIELAGVFTRAKLINQFGKEIVNKNFSTKYFFKKMNSINLDKFIKYILKKGGSPFICPTSMIRKDVYIKLKGYNLNLKYIEDQDMWIRILLQYSLGIINEELIKYRIHENQGSSYYLDMRREKMSIILEHIEKFLKDNNLQQKYNKLIKYAKAIDYVTLSLYAFKLNDYPLFKKRIKESKEYYRLPLKSKSAIIQNIPFDSLKWFFLKKFYRKKK